MFSFLLCLIIAFDDNKINNEDKIINNEYKNIDYILKYEYNTSVTKEKQKGGLLMKNFETKNQKALEWTEEKYKLIELIADIPDDAENTFKYLYAFIGFGMLDGKFCMSNGHQEELERMRAEISEIKNRSLTEKNEELAPEQKRMNEYVIKIVSDIMAIREKESEKVLRYIHILVDDIIKDM